MKRKKAEVLRGMTAVSQSNVWICRVVGVVVGACGWAGWIGRCCVVCILDEVWLAGWI